MIDPGPMTKRHCIYNAFVESQNSKRNRTHVLQFIRLAMSPARYSREPHRFEPMRAALNQALAFAGLVVDDTAAVASAAAATTLPEAQRRARDLRADLEVVCLPGFESRSLAGGRDRWRYGAGRESPPFSLVKRQLRSPALQRARGAKAPALRAAGSAAIAARRQYQGLCEPTFRSVSWR